MICVYVEGHTIIHEYYYSGSSILSFVGTTRNAVEIQIWTALTTMLLLSYMKSIAAYPRHFSNLVHSLRLNTFTKLDLTGWLDNPFSPPDDTPELQVQGIPHSPLL